MEPAGEPEQASDQQELRLAIVMNGGVSLAVWMGGVTRELDRVRRGDGPYGRLLALTGSTARIDVIAGASAGGINGAVLALAIARDTRVDDIRGLWMSDGAIDQLLRDPFERDAPSVLKGDEHLLVKLREAMEAIGRRELAGPPKPEYPPLHLTITGTTLQGQATSYLDRYGAVIPDVDHRAEFRFRRRGNPPVPDPWPDDFARGGGRDDPAAARLALAARSSASFPAAFEPSFCPVGRHGDEPPGADDQHPDMARIADFTDSRWVIDGGVLVNTPFRPALDAIAALPAEAPVRRVLAYVVPNVLRTQDVPDDRADPPSTLTVVIDALSRLPRVQSVGRELEEIEATNRRVKKRRDVRRDMLTSLGPDGLETAARLLLPAYLRTRRDAALDDVVDLLLEGHRAAVESGDRVEPPHAPTAEQVARVRDELDRVDDYPWLPEAAGASELPVRPWRWGFAPVEQMANFVLEVLRDVARLEGLGPDGRTRVRTLRRDYHDLLGQLREIRRETVEHWRAGAVRLRVFARPTAVTELVVGWQAFQGRLRDVADELAMIVDATWQMLGGPGPRDDDTGLLWSLLEPLVRGPDGGAPPGDSDDRVVRRLIALDVVQRASGADISGIEQAVELLLMSADVENSFGGPSRAEDKLAGLQLDHFGAFYKQSWRANDWMWGRLDGADRLVRMLIDPGAIARRLARGEPLEAVVAAVQGIACGGSTESVRDWLRNDWREHHRAASVEAELRQLEGDPHPDPTALPGCYAAVRQRVQLEVLCEEIPNVAAAVVADRDRGASDHSKGSLWQKRLPTERPLPVERVIEAFKACDIGREQIADEMGSDYFTEVSTKTGAVLGSVVGGAANAVQVLRPVLAAIRGVLLSLYLLGLGVVHSSRTASFLVALALALGGALVSLSLVGAAVPGFLVLLGTTVLIAAVVLGLIRQTLPRIVLSVALFAGAGVAYYLVTGWHDRPRWLDTVATVLAVLLMTVSAMLLGSKGKRAPGQP